LRPKPFLYRTKPTLPLAAEALPLKFLHYAMYLNKLQSKS
jgi:hypothetical protein